MIVVGDDDEAPGKRIRADDYFGAHVDCCIVFDVVVAAAERKRRR